MSADNEVIQLRGGEFLSRGSRWEDIFTPEEFTDEHRMIVRTMEKFIKNEIAPLGEPSDKPDYEQIKTIVKTAGDVGILGACLPEEYGGLGLDAIRFALMKEALNTGATSIITAIGGQIGIGVLPIVFFGSDDIKSRYLPGLTAGTITTAFALTEPWAGTDASAIRMSAKLSDDGKYYILNGNKVFITNAGFCDIFVVFAKIDNKQFSAFIVERDSEGLTIGPEEQKMGLKGSSTCSLMLDDVKVPVENLLGKAGKGHQFAFNVLNFGRLSVGAGCLGNTKETLQCAVEYANQRVQFGKKISAFPLIGKKLAEINIKAFALESMVYRTAAMLDGQLKKLDFSDPNIGDTSGPIVGEYMIECAINKVFGSEVLGFAADEGLQIYGGYGYMKEYPIERIYRDARIKRIFEGTNEINRLFIVNTLTRKMSKNQLPCADDSYRSASSIASASNIFEREYVLIKEAKKLFFTALKHALALYGAELEGEQEICSDLADMAINIYAMESCLLRTEKISATKGNDSAQLAIQMSRVFAQEAFDQICVFGRNVARTTGPQEELSGQLEACQQKASDAAVNTVMAKRSVAAKVVDFERYVC